MDGSLYLVVNGLSKHVGADRGYNETNPGYGITYSWGDNRLNHLITVGKYLNSLSSDSSYAGYGRQTRLLGNDALHLDGGFLAGGITGYPDYPVVPALLPMLTLGGKNAALNLMFSPPVEGVTPATFMLNGQYRIK